MHQDATWYGAKHQPRGLCVRWKPTPPGKRGGAPTIFGPCLLCPKAGRIKTTLGIQVGISPGDVVLDEDPAPLPEYGGGAPSPIFGPFPLGQTAGCIKMPLRMEV